MRILSPHALGSKNGELRALFLQSDPMGPTDDLRDQWRCMDLEKLTNAEILDNEWITAGSHTRESSCMDRIDYEVDY